MNRIVIIVVAVILVVFGAYYVNQSSSPVESSIELTTTGAVTTNGETPANFDFASALVNVETINLDFSLFTEGSLFSTLNDNSGTLRAPSKGRRNPFAPFSADAVAQIQVISAPATTTRR